MNDDKDLEGTATYDPEDNKIRFYPFARLDADLYQRVRAAGFIWAPQQKLFVAPMWTPEREDLMIELCGEVGDEDTSLVDRAEERAERFDEYSERRAEEADRAHAAVDGIAQRFEGGQPILVGHHSEKRARKDAERIQNGMRHAIKMWETSKYWEARAKGALRAAKYKELPAVRARRIKTLEADQRRIIASYTPRDKAVILQQKWDADKDAPSIPHVYCGQGSRGGSWVPVEDLETIKARSARWLQHIANRITYERAMLQEQGGIITDRAEVELGGRVLVRGEWILIVKINRKDGKICSLGTNRRYVSTVSIEDVKDYRPPEPGDAEKVKKAMALPPMCNYPGENTVNMTKADYAAVYHDSKGGTVLKATETAGRHRVRTVQAFVARKFGYPADRDRFGIISVFLTDEKRKDPPPPEQEAPPKLAPPERDQNAPPRHVYVEPEPTKFDVLKDALKEGVKIVVAPNLFVTPDDIADQMVARADIEPDMDVLEPQAGTGALVRAILRAEPTSKVMAVEINGDLCQMLVDLPCRVICKDFFTFDMTGKFDRIIMNPPFDHGIDIKHIEHALTMLKPGGRLVTLCAAGPKQRAAFIDRAEEWEDLPPNSFKEAGTGVNVAMVTIDAPEPLTPKQEDDHAAIVEQNEKSGNFSLTAPPTQPSLF
jgi:protein-L-isoaspartate O-methyltransferase